MVIVMAEDQAMEHPVAADGTSRAGGEVEPILPPEPTPTQADGVLRQSDLPGLPTPVPGHGFIYRLLDPITAEPRYVGRSRTPAIRRHGHRRPRSKKKSPVTAWHRRLALHGLIPVMQILEGPVSYAQAAIREEAWRRAHVAAGSELLNAVPCVDGRHEGDTIWTAETAREEVRALASRLQLGGAYPTRRQFADSGLSGLDTAIERRLGGHRAIAAALGLAMPTPEWTLEAAEHAVCNLVAKHGLERYPTPKEFADADQSGLFHAITTHFGGHKAFARRLGLPSARNEWTSETADAAVVSLVARLGGTRRYLTDREMRRYGPPGLENAARRFGGNRTRAARLGLLLRPRWDLDTAAAAVCELVERLSLGGYPTQRHFTDARASGLYRAIAKRLGGHEAMAARLGLQLSHPRRR
jgi:hypothetical protein